MSTVILLFELLRLAPRRACTENDPADSITQYDSAAKLPKSVTETTHDITEYADASTQTLCLQDACTQTAGSDDDSGRPDALHQFIFEQPLAAAADAFVPSSCAVATASSEDLNSDIQIELNSLQFDIARLERELQTIRKRDRQLLVESMRSQQKLFADLAERAFGQLQKDFLQTLATSLPETTSEPVIAAENEMIDAAMDNEKENLRDDSPVIAAATETKDTMNTMPVIAAATELKPEIELLPFTTACDVGALACVCRRLWSTFGLPPLDPAPEEDEGWTQLLPSIPDLRAYTSLFGAPADPEDTSNNDAALALAIHNSLVDCDSDYDEQPSQSSNQPLNSKQTSSVQERAAAWPPCNHHPPSPSSCNDLAHNYQPPSPSSCNNDSCNNHPPSPPSCNNSSSLPISSSSLSAALPPPAHPSRPSSPAHTFVQHHVANSHCNQSSDYCWPRLAPQRILVNAPVQRLSLRRD